MSEKPVVEAALYSAGRPVSAEELARTTGLATEAVTKALRALAREYTARRSALEVVRIGTKWAMQIRPEYARKAQAFAKPEMPPDLLKTAALIAYHQPIKQSELCTMLGEKVYDHVKTLARMRLVTTKPVGRTIELATSRSFSAFFGMKATKREDIKRFMAEKVLGPPSRRE
jgi:segregation and condensation protein B